jgi:predicted nucleic acid-binding protein
MPVVDASVALKWFLADEPDADLALMILAGGAALTAPDIIVAEVCNAAWKSARLGRITQAQVEDIAAALPRFIEKFANSAVLAPRAVLIASQLDHPVYDALYLALAEREAVQVVTADARFQAKVRGTSWQGCVVALTDYKAQGRG